SVRRLPILPVPTDGTARRSAACAHSTRTRIFRRDHRHERDRGTFRTIDEPRQAVRCMTEETVMSSNRNLFINGEWVAAAGGATFPVYNPATGEVWTHVADASREDAAKAIAAARDAQPAWAALSHSER